MKSIKQAIIGFIAGAALAAALWAALGGVIATPAHAQTCNIGGYVGVIPLPATYAGIQFTITSTGAVYRPLTNGWARLYSDGTFQVVSQKVSGSGPNMAEVRAHFQDLDSNTVP